MANALNGEDSTTIYATEALSIMWRASPRGESSALAEGCLQYPMLFDQDDLDLIVNQACDGYHFAEWYAAIHIFTRDGARCLIEKYDTYDDHYYGYRSHRHLEKARSTRMWCQRRIERFTMRSVRGTESSYPTFWFSIRTGPTASPRSRVLRMARSTHQSKSACALTFGSGWACASKWSASNSLPSIALCQVQPKEKAARRPSGT